MGSSPSNGQLVSQPMEGTERGTLVVSDGQTGQSVAVNGGCNLARRARTPKCHSQIMLSVKMANQCD